MKREDLAARLRATFIGELEEQVRAMNAALLDLEAAPQDREHLRTLFRVAHTLKGAAASADVPLVERVCHALESTLAAIRDGTVVLGPSEFQLLFAGADALAEAGERLRSGAGLEDSAVGRLASALEPGASQVPARPARMQPAPEPAAPAPRSRESGETPLRVGAEKLDALLAACGQLVTLGSRVAERPAELAAIRDSAARSLAQGRRSSRRPQGGKGGVSPLPGESRTAVREDLHRLLRDVDRLATRVNEDVRTLTQATAHVTHQVRSLRMRPFEECCEALPRAVRDLAATSHKEVDLEIAGGEVEADRAVLDGMRETLLQLVRNAVDHGIELPDARAAAGKTRKGRVRIAAGLQGDRILVTVSDDGAGLDVDAVLAEVRRRGLPAPSSPQDLGRVLLEAGFSTRAEASTISGRGVGLDIARVAMERVRGMIELEWTPGQGTTFTLSCPLSLASMRCVLVSVGDQILALPAAGVERLLRVRPSEIKRAAGRDVLTLGDAPVPLISAARLLGPPLPDRSPEGTALPVVLLRVGAKRLGLACEALIGEQELVLRPIRSGGRKLRFLSGAALLGNGRVVLVLDAGAVVSAEITSGPSAFVEGEEASPPSRILVVDDSLTTRTLEQSILEAAGYQVVTAVDGAEAWRMLQEQVYDAVVADVEMPRMDGFGLCEALRASKVHAQLPCILVTALETPEHRARGLEVGADAYIGKSSFDQRELLDTLRQLLG
jgi:two-component system chemotaxis sensor kinase CheA